jgi:hypothetical protein
VPEWAITLLSVTLGAVLAGVPPWLIERRRNRLLARRAARQLLPSAQRVAAALKFWPDVRTVATKALRKQLEASPEPIRWASAPDLQPLLDGWREHHEAISDGLGLMVYQRAEAAIRDFERFKTVADEMAERQAAGEDVSGAQWPPWGDDFDHSDRENIETLRREAHDLAALLLRLSL